MVLDVSLVNTLHFKVQIKGKVEQFRERRCHLPYTLVEELSKTEPLGHPRIWSPLLLNLLLTVFIDVQVTTSLFGARILLNILIDLSRTVVWTV